MDLRAIRFQQDATGLNEPPRGLLASTVEKKSWGLPWPPPIRCLTQSDLGATKALWQSLIPSWGEN